MNKKVEQKTLISFLPLLDFWRQFINIIAIDDDLWIDKDHYLISANFNSYYAMNWSPRTTDNSTHFAQSPGI